jgi:hypothetical protein
VFTVRYGLPRSFRDCVKNGGLLRKVTEFTAARHVSRGTRRGTQRGAGFKISDEEGCSRIRMQSVDY